MIWFGRWAWGNTHANGRDKPGHDEFLELVFA